MEAESNETDAELLEALRHYAGWHYWHEDLDSLAEQALDQRVLRWAHDVAMRQWSSGWSGSSASSGTAVVFGPSGRTEDVEAFLGLFRNELLKALANR